MTLSPRARRGLVLAAMVALTASPALAQTTGVGSNLGSFLQTVTSRMNLWLNPHVRAATETSDFDLRDLRSRRISLYLGVTPDNLTRVAPLYALLLQLLIDLNTRERPSAGCNAVPVLVLLDEFARLGHAGVIAHGFAYVAGYGLRLLPVLQSPAQLRAEYGPDLTEEIIANCGAEVVFAPKELRVARDLSERLGYATVPGRTRSRPSGLSGGGRSVSESDHRRALMLPQELLQMPADRLLVLKAGLPPVRGRKITFYRERAFTRRVRPPPTVAARPLRAGAVWPGPKPSGAAADPLTLEAVVPLLDRAGLAPLPPQGAAESEIAAWVERFISDSARPADPETQHAR
ncbi:type IV secretory system conjugative DNA transfer family protein [Phenylobacterium sp.]|jgi:type IV secretion system protein VirD4|uniref:type IV secretory system conjugative DNA transfer family protein n=1 Tax=Phenylobacterium sp. TaxID=1871053 RepID=UPI002E3591E0|nr:type IV secretory system conjugative DNA transfer family protein [Phenylobacterium sp.]HEX3364999.1 type IV secretory system conjugative DNA transfer family protein [Phenylobacterium sp.]